MGMPAARASIDKAAHDGPIQTGSPDVIIGGFPAARKGDTISCTQHGSGIIVGGSGSVLVNGVSLARQGDKTQCNAAGAAAVSKPKPVPPQYWGGSLAKKAGEDGMLHGDNYDARILGAYASLEDSSSDGSYDTVSSGFALEDLTLGNKGSDEILKSEFQNKLGNANAKGSFYNGGGNIYGLNSTAKATGMQYSATGNTGKEETLYASAKGDVTFATAEAKLVAELYTGNKGRYGFNVEGGAGAAVVKEEVAGKLSLYGIVIANAKAGAQLGSVGTAAGVAAYFDETDNSVTLKAKGKLAFWLGVDAGIDLKVYIRPLRELIIGKDSSPENSENEKSGDGVIISGCTTVFIGS